MEDSLSGYDLAREGDRVLWFVPLFMLAGYLAGPHLESILLHFHRAWHVALLLLTLVAVYFLLRRLARRRLGIDGGESGGA